MKTDQIEVGRRYSNGKGAVREVLSFESSRLYPGQMDTDSVRYRVVNQGRHYSMRTGAVSRMTRAAFATWAKDVQP